MRPRPARVAVAATISSSSALCPLCVPCSRRDYIRNKAKEEVDFLVAKDGNPWFLAEAKASDTKITPALAAMQKATGASHAFQVVRDLPYADADAFAYQTPVAVSARGFLSQLF